MVEPSDGLLDSLYTACVTIRLLEENTRNKLHNIHYGNSSLDLTPKAQATIAEIDQWDYIKLKYAQQKNNQWSEKTTYREGIGERNIFANYT